MVSAQLKESGLTKKQQKKTQKWKPLLSFIVATIKAEKEIKPLIKITFKSSEYSSQNHHALLNNFYLEKWWILTLPPVVCMLNSECGEYISLLHNPSLLLHNVIFQSGLRNCICAGMTERETLLRWMSLKKETSRHFYHIHWLCSGENKLYWNHIWERNILY